MDLQTAVKHNMWPSPKARDWRGAGKPNNANSKRHSPDLNYVVKYPTPKTNGFCGGSGAAKKVRNNGNLTDEEKRSMLAGNGGQLNPDWVEWLMGWPVGWTDEKCTAPVWLDWQNDPADTGNIPRITTRKNGRTARLKAIGNGQVPLCAAVMFEWGMMVLKENRK